MSVIPVVEAEQDGIVNLLFEIERGVEWIDYSAGGC
jgi:hypothetical protein